MAPVTLIEVKQVMRQQEFGNAFVCLEGQHSKKGQLCFCHMDCPHAYITD